jgi:pimeloyl-ACP methyl ester carboxylesterase
LKSKVVELRRYRTAEQVAPTRVTEGVLARPVYLATEPDSAFAMVHLPSSIKDGATGVVLCPPFGWHDMSTYRTRRAWAFALARAGHPTIRLDLPGTGDSGGTPREPELVAAWTKAVAAAAQWLRDETGCRRIAGFGIGLGGILAWLAAAQGAPIDDLALWAVPTKGRRLLREIEAFARFELDANIDLSKLSPEARELATSAAAEEELTDPAGQIMTKQTIASLRGLDMTKLPLAESSRRRILLIESDGVALDKRLREYFDGSGADVTVDSGEGYGAMMRYARFSDIPDVTIARSIAWLDDVSEAGAGGVARGSTAPVRSTQTLELSCQGTTIRETPVTIELESGRIFGILTEPVDAPRLGVCGLFFNSGSDRRTGPARLWVETARRWAARGVPSVRIDQLGIGDSDGDEDVYDSVLAYFDDRVTERTVAILDELEARGLPNRFVLVGHCSSAYWAIQGALADRRVVGAVPINLSFFFCTWWAVNVSHGWLIQRKPRADDSRAKALALRIMKWAFDLLPLARRTLRAARPGPDRIDAALDRLQARGVELVIPMTPIEPLYRELTEDRRIDALNARPNVRLRRIPGTDIRYRPVPLQRFVSDELDEGLRRVLEATGRATPAPVRLAKPA